MQESLRQLMARRLLIMLILLIAAIAMSGFGAWRYYVLTNELRSTRADFAAQKDVLEQNIAELTRERDELSEALYSEQQKSRQLQAQIDYLAETVGVLEKWRELDPELLQKYSKVYFLNEHYTPSDLSVIPEKYLTEERIENEEKAQIHSRVLPRLERMLVRAANDGMNIKVASAYRSFGEQSSLKSNYTITYGAGTANQFSADQGYSEHQLGTTVDLVTPETAGTFSGFEETKEYRWLQDNAYRYGFTLSYPEDNGYYVFEPWHWRFVGERLATYLQDNDLHFYDMDQREIDQFLIDIFE